MTHLEEVARWRYAAGATAHSATIRAQVELARLHDRVRRLEDQRGPSVARLNALLDRPAHGTLPWPSQVPAAAVPLEEERAAQWLVQGNPRLGRLDHLAGKAAASGGLAAKRGYPGVSLGVEYIDTGKPLVAGVPAAGKDPLMVTVSATVPVWRGAYRAEVRAAQLEESAIRQRR